MDRAEPPLGAVDGRGRAGRRHRPLAQGRGADAGLGRPRGLICRCKVPQPEAWPRPRLATAAGSGWCQPRFDMCTVDGSRQPLQTTGSPVASRPRLARVLLPGGHPIEGGPHAAQAHPVARPGLDPLPGHRPGRERPRRLASRRITSRTRASGTSTRRRTARTSRPRGWRPGTRLPPSRRPAPLPPRRARAAHHDGKHDKVTPLPCADRPAGRLPARGHHVRLREVALRRLARRRGHLEGRRQDRQGRGPRAGRRRTVRAGLHIDSAGRLWVAGAPRPARSASTAAEPARSSRPTRSRPRVPQRPRDHPDGRLRDRLGQRAARATCRFSPWGKLPAPDQATIVAADR